MYLQWKHPILCEIPCELCLKHPVDFKTGRFDVLRDGKTLEPRILNGDVCHLAPCRDPARGCLKGTPEKPNTLNQANQDCYEHYSQCKAVGQFPDDPIVRRNAAVIVEVKEQIEREELQKFRQMMAELAKAKRS